MNRTNPHKLSLYTALIIAVFCAGLFSVFSYVLFDELPLLPSLVILLVVFFVSYFLFRYVLIQFIYEKIRLIYKNIHHKKEILSEKPKKIRVANVDEVNEEVLNWMKTQQEEIETLKKGTTFRREYLGNVSHELKTPVFNTQGYILTLLDGAMENPEINKKYLLRAEKSINRMITIIEDLEEISHLEYSEMNLNYEDFNIIAIAKEVIDTLETKASAKNIRIYFKESAETSVMVHADKEKISRVLVNLMDNSLKYGKEDGETKISFFDMDDHILIEVTDNGIGIATEHISRIFERFYTADKSRSREQGGSGLGLSIVKHIIEVHNTSINVRSTKDIGTTFAFTLKKS